MLHLFLNIKNNLLHNLQNYCLSLSNCLRKTKFKKALRVKNGLSLIIVHLTNIKHMLSSIFATPWPCPQYPKNGVHLLFYADYVRRKARNVILHVRKLNRNNKSFKKTYLYLNSIKVLKRSHRSE